MSQKGAIHAYLKVWQNKHIHEMKTHKHKTNSNNGNTSLKCMDHQH